MSDFTLVQGGRVALTVRSPEDEPVGVAVVVVLDAAGKPIGESFTLDTMFSTSALRTDAAGRLEIRGLAAGSYRIRVTKGAATSISDVVEVFEGTATALALRLNAGAAGGTPGAEDGE